MDDIRLLMDEAMAERPPDFVQAGDKPEHGRLERRSIWASAEINDYVRFPGVGQVFAVRREVTELRTGERRAETAYGVTSLRSEAAAPKRLLELNRGHWRNAAPGDPSFGQHQAIYLDDRNPLSARRDHAKESVPCRCCHRPVVDFFGQS